MTKKIFSQKNTSVSPKLYDCGGDLEAKWFVWYRDDDGKRIKVYSLAQDKAKNTGLNKIKNLTERYKYAEAIVLEIQTSNPKQARAGSPKTDTETVSTIHDKSNIAGIYSYVIEKNKHLWRRKTILQYKTHIKLFFLYCRQRKIKVITESVAIDFFNDLINKGRSKRTVNSYRMTLSRLWTIATKENLLPKDNPFASLPAYRENRESCLPFSKEQRHELREYIGKHNPMLWLCCQFLYYCFIRPGELRLLKVGDIDLDRGMILVRGAISKNKKTQRVVIPEVFLRILKGYGLKDIATGLYVIGVDKVGGQDPIGVGWIGKNHRKILKRLNYETGQHAYNFYGWKHTGVIEAVLAGINLGELRKQLRHHSLEEMMHYIQKLGLDDCSQIRNNFPEM